MAARSTGAHVCPVLRGAGAFRGRICRCLAQGPGDVFQQCHQDRWLPDDAVRLAPPDCLCRGGAGRSGLFPRQVRHPHRAAAGLATGQGQRLDRGADHCLHHPGGVAGRAAGGTPSVGSAAVHRHTHDRFRHPHRRRSGHCRADPGVCPGRLVQHAHPPYGRGDAPAAPAPATQHSGQHAGPAARLLGLQQPPVARQAGADFAVHHHPVLGRGGQPQVHRAGLGRGGAGLQHHQRRRADRRGGHWHRRWRGPVWPWATTPRRHRP